MDFTPPYIYCGLFEQEEFARAIGCVKAVCEQVIEREHLLRNSWTVGYPMEQAVLLAQKLPQFNAEQATAYMQAKTAPLLSNILPTATGQAIAREMYRAQLVAFNREQAKRRGIQYLSVSDIAGIFGGKA